MFLVYLMSIILRLRKDNSGAVASEYSVLIAFIAIVAAVGMVALGPNIADFFGVIADWVPEPEPESPPCPLGGPPPARL